MQQSPETTQNGLLQDLSRTGATMMQEPGVRWISSIGCQNHLLGGSKVRWLYLYFDYAKEKMGQHLATIFARPSHQR
jgi:hypothetical protein